MTEIRKSKIYILVLLITILPFISTSSNLFQNYEIAPVVPRSSGYWTMGPLHIKQTGGGDYTWSEAAAQPWCNGNGTLIDPFVIENVTIDAGGANSGILIEDSQDLFFTIRNCTLTNAGGDS